MCCDESPPQDGARHVFLSFHIKLGSYQAPPTLSCLVLEYFIYYKGFQIIRKREKGILYYWKMLGKKIIRIDWYWIAKA